jgi:hypothetical protein
MPGFSDVKIKACADYAVHHLNKLNSKQSLLKAAPFWGINIDRPQDWLDYRSPDHVKNKAFKALSIGLQFRVLANAAATYYGERLTARFNQYEEASTVEKAQLVRDKENYLSTTVFKTLSPQEQRDYLADVSHAEPKKTVTGLIHATRKNLLQPNDKYAKWSASFHCPKLTKLINDASEVKVKANRQLGTLTLDMEKEIQWAKVELFNKHFTEGSMGAAAGMLGGRRGVEYLNPLYVMTEAGEHKVHLNFQAKQGKGTPAPKYDDDEDSDDIGTEDMSITFDVACTASDYLRARGQLQQLFQWGDDQQDIKNVANCRAKVNKFVKESREFKKVRERVIEKYGKMVPHTLRKLYVAYIVYTKQQAGLAAEGDAHNLWHTQDILQHKSAESSKNYNLFIHKPEEAEAVEHTTKRKVEWEGMTEAECLDHLVQEVTDVTNPLPAAKRRRLNKVLLDLMPEEEEG